MADYNLSFTGAQLDDAIRKVQAGYILPSGTIDIDENEDGLKIKEYEYANVNVSVPDTYIKKSDTIFYTTKHAQGQYTPGSNTAVSQLNLDFGLTGSNKFTPKIFIIRPYSGVGKHANENRGAVTNSAFVLNNSYEDISTYFPSTTYVNPNSKTTSSGAGTAANSLIAYNGGVRGNGGNAVIDFMAGLTYYWEAWG